MRIILISHGGFSKGALQAASMIIGECDYMSAVGLEPEDDLESMAAKIEDEIVKNNAADEEILVLSDLFYGSPFNSVVTLMPNYKIHHITGMNLAMIIEAANMVGTGDAMEDIVAVCLESGKEGVVNVNKFLDL